jgi:hypothetical protein
MNPETLHSITVSMKSLNIASSFDKHFGRLIFTEIELLRETAYWICNEPLLVELLGFSFLKNGLYFLLKLLSTSDFRNNTPQFGTQMAQESFHLIGVIEKGLRTSQSCPVISAGASAL